jgi:hypothetical protein
VKITVSRKAFAFRRRMLTMTHRQLMIKLGIQAPGCDAPVRFLGLDLVVCRLGRRGLGFVPYHACDACGVYFAETKGYVMTGALAPRKKGGGRRAR